MTFSRVFQVVVKFRLALVPPAGGDLCHPRRHRDADPLLNAGLAYSSADQKNNRRPPSGLLTPSVASAWHFSCNVVNLRVFSRHP
jgi:hypothetical protein